MQAGLALLAGHVARFNAGVRSGDFGPMVDGFSEDAELVFEGIPVGPFRGREAIAAAYRTRPPDDEIELLDAEQDSQGRVVASYAWRRRPGVRAGALVLVPRGGRITRLVIHYGDDGLQPADDRIRQPVRRFRQAASPTAVRHGALGGRRCRSG
jgi:hypothetical protein